MSELKILLLGSPEIILDGQKLTFESGKAVALLAYLAVTESAHPRPALATLLWPESDSARARGALRYTLALLKKSIPAEWLKIERQEIDLVRTSQLQVDVAQFQQVWNQSQIHNHPDDEMCAACINALTVAAQYYRDDFMTGFTLRDSPPFDEWQFFQTENLRRDATLVLAKLAVHYTYQEHYETALSYARQWLHFDPLHEPAHRQLMALYAAAGQRAAALRQYDRCIKMLSDEFGIMPSPETEQIYRQIQQIIPESGLVPTTEAMPLPIDNLPLQPTPCIGRETELAELNYLLKDENIRLINIMGVGGIGKTRLALEVAVRQRGCFGDGIFFVSLASLGQMEGVASAIAEVLGLTFAEGHPPLAQVQDFLRNREVLLLLDNIEHLLANTVPNPLNLITDLLQAAPSLKIVTTSRVRLQSQWEHGYPLQGLDIPAEPLFEALIPNGEDAFDLNQYPAVTLFQQRSQQVYQANDATVLTDVARICRLTEGMPLAIELAAAMTHVLSLPAIATEIAQNYSVLQADWRDVNARHHSIQAVFDSTWHTLIPVEQTIFARLAVFRGGFTLEAAVKVAQATLSTLTSLVNKSLVYRRSTGRFEIHELMRQYAADKLTNLSADQQRVQRRHRDHYVAFLNQQVTDWQIHYRQENLAAINVEIDNLRQAWQYTFKVKELVTLCAFTSQLYLFYNARGRYTEAVEVISQALRLLQTQTNRLPDLPQATLAYLLGKAYWGAGQMDRGLQCLKQALQLNGTPLPKNGWPMVWSFCKIMLRHFKRHLPSDIRDNLNAGADNQVSLLAAQIYDTLSQMGHTKNDQALAGFAIVRSLSYAEMAGSSPILAVGYANMSTLFSAVGSYRYAAYYATMANTVLHQSNALPAQASVGMRLKIYYSSLGRWEQATVEGRRALRGFQQLDDRRNWGDCLTSLGLVALLRGNYDESLTYAAALQVHAKNNYNNEQYALAVCGHAFILLHRSQREEATALLSELAPLLANDKVLTTHCRAVYHAVMAMAHLRAGQVLEAIEAADQAVAVLPNKATLIPPMAMFYNHVPETYLAIWERASVDVTLAKRVDITHVQNQARTVCRDMVRLAWLFPLRRMFDYLRQGQYKWLSGKPYMARRLWRRSLSQAERMAVPYVEAAAHFQLGRHLPVGDTNRERHLCQAKDIFQRLNASYDLSQVMLILNEGESID